MNLLLLNFEGFLARKKLGLPSKTWKQRMELYCETYGINNYNQSCLVITIL